MHEILREIDTNMNGQVELDEYLQVRNFILFLDFYPFLFTLHFFYIRITKLCQSEKNNIGFDLDDEETIICNLSSFT